MSTTEYVLKYETEYILVSTAELGPPGLPGAPGAKGSSATPGVEIGEPYIDQTGHVAFDFTTHWGLTAEGVPYYEPDADDVPEEERAMLDPFTLTLTLGGPGRVDRPRVTAAGQWAANTLHHRNELVGHLGGLFLVTTDFRSGSAFDTTYLEYLAGEQAA